jgi:beta-1,4-mannosyl-glycoprotein beta-1,4-N-acetylglucosaminyltransferase
VKSHKLVDNILYSGEDNMLLFRLHELNECVDIFNIVEGRYSFQGNKKDIVFDINKFIKFKDKIRYSIYEELPQRNPGVNINNLRIFLSSKVYEFNLNDNDIIMLSDVDEIPDTDILTKIRTEKLEEFTFFQNFYYYNIKTRCYFKWKGTALVTFEDFKNKYRDFSNLREKKNSFRLVEGGWHFSYFGGEKAIMQKLKTFDHPEYNTEMYCNSENIKKAITEGKDLFLNNNGRAERFEIVEETYLPKYFSLIKVLF